MKDLTPAELDELADEVATFVGDMALVGLACIVVVSGRGVSKVAYSQEIASQAPDLLTTAVKQSREYNARNAN